MARGVELVVKILTDASNAAAGIDKATTDFGKFESGMKSLAVPAAVAGAAVAGIGVAAVNAASDTQQAMGAVDAVFGASADQVKKWASEAVDSVGLTSAEYAQFASVVGAQLKNLGVPMDQVAGGTDDLIKLGADLAATYGGTTQEAVNALSAALRGEADPAERYGLALNQTRVNAELAAQGLSGLEGEALTAAKAQTIMALATEQAGGAVGQYGREADTVAGQQQRANAAWGEAAAALGTALLPVMTTVTAAFAQMGKFVQQNASWILPLIGVIGALAGAILLINGAIAAYNAVQAVMKAVTVVSTAAQWAWNAAMTANPIGIIIAAVAALVAAFIYLWNTNEEFRNFFISLWEGIASFFVSVWEGAIDVVKSVVNWFKDAWDNVANFFKTVWQVAVAVVQAYFNAYVIVFTAIFNAVKAVVQAVVNFFVQAWQNAVNGVTAVIKTLQSIFTSVFNAIMVPINAVVNAFKAVINAIQDVISWLGRIKIPDVFGAIGNFFGGGARSAAPAAAAPAPAARALSAYSGPSVGVLTARAASSSGGVTINVTGGLSTADDIGRAVQRALQSRQRRTSGVTIPRRAT